MLCGIDNVSGGSQLMKKGHFPVGKENGLFRVKKSGENGIRTRGAIYNDSRD